VTARKKWAGREELDKKKDQDERGWREGKRIVKKKKKEHENKEENLKENNLL
jgi:hypothetical protein